MKIMSLIFAGIFLIVYSAVAQTTQPDAAQPQHNEQQQENLEQQEMEQQAPEQIPDQLEQNDERVQEPGQENIQNEQDPQNNFQNSDFINRFENAEPIKMNELPEMVMTSFRDGYFQNWNILEIYNATALADIDVPAEYVLRVEKNNVKMNLYYLSNGELLMQEKASLQEKL
jgi:hypothetical protein